MKFYGSSKKVKPTKNSGPRNQQRKYTSNIQSLLRKTSVWQNMWSSVTLQRVSQVICTTKGQ